MHTTYLNISGTLNKISRSGPPISIAVRFVKSGLYLFRLPRLPKGNSPDQPHPQPTKNLDRWNFRTTRNRKSSHNFQSQAFNFRLLSSWRSAQHKKYNNCKSSERKCAWIQRRVKQVTSHDEESAESKHNSLENYMTWWNMSNVKTWNRQFLGCVMGEPSWCMILINFWRSSHYSLTKPNIEAFAASWTCGTLTEFSTVRTKADLFIHILWKEIDHFVRKWADIIFHRNRIYRHAHPHLTRKVHPRHRRHRRHWSHRKRIRKRSRHRKSHLPR